MFIVLVLVFGMAMYLMWDHQDGKTAAALHKQGNKQMREGWLIIKVGLSIFLLGFAITGLFFM